MLVLSRREGEAIAIGDSIALVVTEISASQIRIGIVAPPDVPILRTEVPGGFTEAAKTLLAQLDRAREGRRMPGES